MEKFTFTTPEVFRFLIFLGVLLLAGCYPVLFLFLSAGILGLVAAASHNFLVHFLFIPGKTNFWDFVQISVGFIQFFVEIQPFISRVYFKDNIMQDSGLLHLRTMMIEAILTMPWKACGATRHVLVLFSNPAAGTVRAVVVLTGNWFLSLGSFASSMLIHVDHILFLF